ncbi:MAG: GTPase Era [Solirubrobacteraceae bacterium]
MERHLTGARGEADRAGVTRSGFVALAGRPNVGKSTLVNAIVGDKVAIVSDRPQTTRRAIRGVRTSEDAQLVLVDLPGVQRPRDALTQRMAGRVAQEIEDSDAVLLVLNGEQGVGPGDRYIAAALAAAPEGSAPTIRSGPGAPVTIAVNKIDRLSRPRVAAVLQEAADLGVGEDIFPISARTGTGVQELVEHLVGLMPQGPFMFSPHDVSDLPESLRVAELIREAAIRRTFQEVPHALEVVVEEIEQAREGLVRVSAIVWVETESQKGILVGRAGRMIKAIGTAARRELERELDSQVHLEVSVRVRRDWRADESLLDRLGIV